MGYGVFKQKGNTTIYGKPVIFNCAMIYKTEQRNEIKEKNWMER